MERRTLLMLGIAALFVPQMPRAQDHTGLLQQLRKGGCNIYFRHSLTIRASQSDDDLTSCASQRNLTEDGVALSRQIGRHMRALQIPVGEVLASPYCRCVDTARWAFDRVAIADWLETNGDADNPKEQARVTRLGSALNTAPAAGSNAVFVAHGNNLGGLAQLHGWPRLPIAEAEAVVFRPAGGAIPDVLARIKGGEWAAMNRA